LALARIVSLQSFLEPFKSYAPEVMAAIRGLEAMKELLKETTEDRVNKVVDNLRYFEQQVEPYREMAPDIASEILKKIAEIRECLS